MRRCHPDARRRTTSGGHLNAVVLACACHLWHKVTCESLTAREEAGGEVDAHHRLNAHTDTHVHSPVDERCNIRRFAVPHYSQHIRPVCPCRLYFAAVSTVPPLHARSRGLERPSVSGAPLQCVSRKPPVCAMQFGELALNDAPTTSGTSINASTELLSDGQSDHDAVAVAPQKYCGFEPTVSWPEPPTATELCVAFTTTSCGSNGSMVPSGYTRVAYTSARSPARVRD
eukprot:5457723-Prymnesium_polylepis.1